MSTTIHELLDELRAKSLDERDKGDKFERLMQGNFRTDPEWARQFSDVWLWSEWPGREGKPDTGTDLVARDRDTDEYTAIQCKFYAAHHNVQRADIDSFFTASGKTPFSRRIVVSTSDKWGKNAEDALVGQRIPTQRLDVSYLNDSTIDWDGFTWATPSALPTKGPKTLRPHQTKALEAVIDGFSTADRGKLIMAAASLEECVACAVLIGEAGIEGWHRREFEAALAKQDSGYPVIPVASPGAGEVVDDEPFLRLMTWIDFQAGLDDDDAFDRLLWGITGLRAATRPGPSNAAKIRIHGDEARLRALDNATVSGEGRFVERESLDIASAVVRGAYADAASCRHTSPCPPPEFGVQPPPLPLALIQFLAALRQGVDRWPGLRDGRRRRYRWWRPDIALPFGRRELPVGDVAGAAAMKGGLHGLSGAVRRRRAGAPTLGVNCASRPVAVPSILGEVEEDVRDDVPKDGLTAVSGSRRARCPHC